MQAVYTKIIFILIKKKKRKKREKMIDVTNKYMRISARHIYGIICCAGIAELSRPVFVPQTEIELI